LTSATIAGGDGNDTLSLAYAATATYFSGDAGSDVYTFGSVAFATSTMRGGANEDSISFLGTSLSGAVIVDGGASADSILFTSALISGGLATLSGGDGNDSLVFTNASLNGAVSFFGGSGNDSFTFTGLTGVGSTQTAYFWNQSGTTEADSIIFSGNVDTNGVTEVFGFNSSITNTVANVISLGGSGSVFGSSTAVSNYFGFAGNISVAFTNAQLSAYATSTSVVIGVISSTGGSIIGAGISILGFSSGAVASGFASSFNTGFATTVSSSGGLGYGITNVAQTFT